MERPALPYVTLHVSAYWPPQSFECSLDEILVGHPLPATLSSLVYNICVICGWNSLAGMDELEICPMSSLSKNVFYWCNRDMLGHPKMEVTSLVKFNKNKGPTVVDRPLV